MQITNKVTHNTFIVNVHIVLVTAICLCHFDEQFAFLLVLYTIRVPFSLQSDHGIYMYTSK